MTRLGDILHGLAAAAFVIAGMAYALIAEPAAPRLGDDMGMIGPLLPAAGRPEPFSPLPIARLYLQPQNPLMWVLLLSVFAVVVLDAVGQWIDPTERPGQPGRHIRSLLLIVLVALAAAPWLFPRISPGFVTLTTLAAGAAVIAARRAAGRQRPAVGFVAGWATAVSSAAMAALIGTMFSLPVQWVAALAILPATAFGMAAQLWIGQSIGYSGAMIWAFCALAVTTMGSDPTIALAAILGIAGMASVLVRAAS